MNTPARDTAQLRVELDIDEGDLRAGEEMHAWLRALFPICRSLTGPGVRETLSFLQHQVEELTVESVPSGTRAFDWEVPEEWTFRSAVLYGPDGEPVLDSADSNLHIMGYSEPIDVDIDLDDLQAHLFTQPDQPEAVPYVTSYYRRNWGFCLSEGQRQALAPGRYRACIDADLAPGVLNYGEIVLPGTSGREILLSTYVCHPSMANNELSGPVLATALARWLKTIPQRRYTYRIVFLPETIGSIVYLSRHLEELKQRLDAGFVLTCVGDERDVSYLASRYGDTLADRMTRHVLGRYAPGYSVYDYTQRGSDERQYCSPGVDLPVVSVMRSKYGEYPEYHTSLDDCQLVTPRGLAGSYMLYRRLLTSLECNRTMRAVFPCEPQLGKRGLYPTVSQKGRYDAIKLQMNVLAYCDGSSDLLGIAERLGADVVDCGEVVDRLEAGGVLKPVAST